MKSLKIAFVILTLGSVSLFASNGEDLVKQNGCMDCHNVVGKKAAPAFRGIARRNTKWHGSAAQENIENSVKNGSSGKYLQFKGSEMPAYGHLSDAELKAMSEWILSL